MAAAAARPTSGRLRTLDIAVAPEEQVDFAALLLPDSILKGIRELGWIHPSPIQLKSIPFGRFGSDLIAQAKSGTGKTGVFAIIALSHIDTSIPMPQVIILEPTREIAQQSCNVINTIGKYVQGLQCKTFIGGISAEKDAAALKNCHIVVGTPGRILQLQEDKRLRPASISLVVLDEADKLFEPPMDEQVINIVKRLKNEKQVLALSATFTEATLDQVKALMRQPQQVMLAPDTPSLQGVRQYYYQIPESASTTAAHVFAAKVSKLLEIFSRSPFHQCLLFTNDRGRVDALKRRLEEEGWPSAYIAGGLAQQERSNAIAALRDFKIRVLISTDLTARGIDVDRVNLVINLDMPHDPETYLHRIGRTGRFGTLGVAVSFVDRSELQVVRRIVDLYQTTVDPLPDEIPRELYTFELTSEADKQAAKRLEGKREAKKDNSRPVEASEFVSVANKRARAQIEGEEEEEEEEEEIEYDEECEEEEEYEVEEEEGGEEKAERGDNGEWTHNDFAEQSYSHLNPLPSTHLPASHLVPASFSAASSFPHWNLAPPAVLGAFGGVGAPGFAEAAAWYWAGYGHAMQLAKQYYEQQQTIEDVVDDVDEEAIE